MVAAGGCDGGVIVYGSEIDVDGVIGGRSNVDNAEESGIAVRLKPMVGSLSKKVWE